MKLSRFSSHHGLAVVLMGLGLVIGPGHGLALEPLGTDVSSFQGSGLNWTTIKNDGIMFAWTKAAEGTATDGYIGEDADFVTNEVKAKAAGVLIGAYYFARPSADPNITGASSADSEAQFFWSVASNYVKTGGGYLVPMLDWEDPYITNAGLNFTAAKLSQWVNEWCNDVSNYALANGVTIAPVVYTGAWYSDPANGYPGLTTAVTNWPNWMAAYPSCTDDEGTEKCGTTTPQTGNPGDIYPWANWNIWQYGDTNWSGGDSDIFNGTTNQFLQLFVIGNTNAPPDAALDWNPSTSRVSPGSGGSANWDNSTADWWLNGSSNLVWPTDGNAVFAGTAGTVTLVATITAGSLAFDTSGYVLTGTSETLVLDSPGIISIPSGITASIDCVFGGVRFSLSGGGTVVLNNGNNYSDGETVTGPNTTLEVATDHDAGNDSVTMNLKSGGIYQDADSTSGDEFLLPGCAVSLGSGGGIFENPNANLTMSNFITGAGSLTLIGTTHTLTLTDTTNSYTGGTIVQSGTLKANAAGTLGSTSGALTVSGGTLDLGGAFQTVGTVTISGGTIQDGTLTCSSYASQSGTVTAVLAGSGAAMTKTTTGTLTLSAIDDYSGNTTISAGTLALGSAGSINDSPLISLAAGATYDVSAISSYTLSSSTTLSASGTATEAIIKGGTTVNLGSRPITLTYNGSNPALTISQGTLSLNGNAFTVNGTPLAGDNTYIIVQQASGNITSSGSYTVTGTAVSLAGTTSSISVSGGYVVLTVNDTTTITLNSLTASTYGQSVTFTATITPTPPGGTVQFYNNGVAMGGPVMASGGTASYTASALSAGSHPITASYSGTTGFDASSTASASSQQVNPAPLGITPNPQTKTYGQTVVFSSGSTNFTSSGLQFGETIGSVTLSVNNNGGAATAQVSGSPYTITPGAATGGTFTAANYNITYNTNTLTVFPATLTVTANDLSWPYGAPNPAFTVAYTNFVNGETLPTSDVAGSSALTTDADTNSPVGDYDITNSLGTLTSTNYIFNLVDGTLTVTNALSTNVVSSSENPALPGDSVTFTATLSTLAPSLAVPYGSVQFQIDGAPFGGPVTLSNGVAVSADIASLSHGYHTNEADYAGDTNIAGSTNTLIQLINTPPVAGPAAFERAQNFALSIAISDLLTNASDADGDALSLASVSATSTNGAAIATNAAFVFYDPPAVNGNVTDSFSYTVADIYGATNSNTVTVTIDPDFNAPSVNITGITLLGNGAAQMSFTGTQGYVYLIEAATNLAPPICWTAVGTNAADTNGVFNFTDCAATNYNARYYRAATQQ